ncbi:MAG: methyltransferase [Desulfobacteraceae bacterium]|nr:methyltransferase [Desulfobacteraceae bacterium]
MEKFSADNFFAHGLDISQPKKGYRFSMDPFILAAHVQIQGAENIIDVGCGCGIIPLILSIRYPDLNILGVEIQKELSIFARQNVTTNQLENKIQIINDDIKNIKPCDINGKVDIIVSNPPYKKKESGRVNPNSQKAVARHEIRLDIDSLFHCSNKLLNKHGKVYIIFPAERLSDLILAMYNYKFTLGTLKFIHIKKGSPARLMIVCAKKGPTKNCIVESPLYIYSSENKFTDEYACLMKI